MAEKPVIFVFAGPNGAGKTTFANTILPRFLGINDFVNADTIARGLSAFAPETTAMQAGRLMLKRLNELLEKGKPFAFESTLSSRTFLPYFKQAQRNGYEIHLFYIWVNSADTAISRVTSRVRQGGHLVPDDDIKRRYVRSISNMLDMYLPLADYAEIHYNKENNSYIKIATKHEGDLTVWEEALWKSVTATIKAK